jgi:hypothetical protein
VALIITGSAAVFLHWSLFGLGIWLLAAGSGIACPVTVRAVCALAGGCALLAKRLEDICHGAAPFRSRRSSRATGHWRLGEILCNICKAAVAQQSAVWIDRNWATLVGGIWVLPD